MQLRLILLAFAILGLALPVWADPKDASYSAQPSDLYTSSPGNGAIPSGDINLTPGTSGFPADAKNKLGLTPYTDKTAPTGDTTNLLGCGGVGQNEYTSALYNMPESFGKFQTDVDSVLSKQILTMNYIMPQTAALFDQLNNFGNQRYQQFQKGCQVDALKQDARNQFLNSCVTKLLPERTQIVRTLSNSPQSGNEDAPATLSEDMINAMAYAQAWEICSNGSISNTTALSARKQTLDDFAKQTRATENVNLAIQSLFCPNAGNSSTDSSTKGCWPSLLLPQVRLCNDSSLQGSCEGTENNGYGVKEPLLTMSRLFDTMRFVMDDTVVARHVTPFNQSIIQARLTPSLQRLAAGEAALNLSSAALTRNADGSADPKTSPPSAGAAGGAAAIPAATVAAFQLSYLNCTQADMFNPLKQYAAKITERLKPATGTATTATKTISLTVATSTDVGPVVKRLALDTTASTADDATALQELVWTSLGCTANQSVPIFDPNITASLNTQCSPDDRYAFYTMAEYDVSLAATRDVYRYLALRLKQIYTTLLTQSTVPSPTTTTAGSTGSSTPTVSPELNSRLATAVKEVMIPYVESQIDRLNDLNASRGDFAQRVQSIYANKAGCMFGGGNTVNLPLRGPVPTPRPRN